MTEKTPQSRWSGSRTNVLVQEEPPNVSVGGVLCDLWFVVGPMFFGIANGSAEAILALPTTIAHLFDYHAMTYISNSTPPVFSLGGGCMHEGYRVFWVAP